MPILGSNPDPSLVEFTLSRLEGAREPLEARLQRLEGRQLRIALWLIAAEGAAVFRHGLGKVDGLRMLAFGVRDDRGLFPLRGRLWRRSEDRLSLVVTAFYDPETFFQPPQELDALSIEGEDGAVERVPVRWQPWRLIPHAPLNLFNATLCCWVKPSAGGDGIVTARHAAVEDRVQLDDGTVEHVLWYAPGNLDALVANSPPGRSLSSLPIAVPLGEDMVEVMTKFGALSRAVADVGQTWGTTTSAIPHLFLLDGPLEEGDSGSLVRLTESGEGLGLYIGELITPEGPRGLCQGLHQLDSLFRFEGQSEGFYEE